MSKRDPDWLWENVWGFHVEHVNAKIAARKALAVVHLTCVVYDNGSGGEGVDSTISTSGSLPPHNVAPLLKEVVDKMSADGVDMKDIFTRKGHA